jgi:hypothetical protein
MKSIREQIIELMDKLPTELEKELYSELQIHLDRAVPGLELFDPVGNQKEKQVEWDDAIKSLIIDLDDLFDGHPGSYNFGIVCYNDWIKALKSGLHKIEKAKAKAIKKYQK